MSCLMSTARLISMLARYATSNRLYRPNRPYRVGVLLHEANRTAYRTRYSHSPEILRHGDVSYYWDLAGAALARILSPIEVFKAAAFYEYQACDAREWEGSALESLINAIQRHAMERLPGYSDAPCHGITNHSICMLATYVTRHDISRPTRYTQADWQLSDAEIFARELHCASGDVAPFRWEYPARSCHKIEIAKTAVLFADHANGRHAWEQSWVRKIVCGLPSHVVMDIPGYDAAPWGF